MRISRKWKRHSEVYRFFAERQCSGLDYTEPAARAAFEAESSGAKHDLSRNGYAIGKHWANVQGEAWAEGVEDGLFRWDEILEDPELAPIQWWVRQVCAKHIRRLAWS